MFSNFAKHHARRYKDKTKQRKSCLLYTMYIRFDAADNQQESRLRLHTQLRTNCPIRWCGVKRNETVKKRGPWAGGDGSKVLDLHDQELLLVLEGR